MGSGSWSSSSANAYTKKTRGVSYGAFKDAKYSAQEMYSSRSLHSDLDPKNVVRECCDTNEHPLTVPVILALDVTGSMGDSAVRVAQRLNDIMTNIYSAGSVKDVEFCVMGIGDLSCDDAPIQISQFESDIRIAEHLDKVWFEGGGGGNRYESYSAAWYMGLNHCKLDCWDRGEKGIIITLGDELPNPYLPRLALSKATGDSIQLDLSTNKLLKETQEKFDIYHISVNDRSSCYQRYNEMWKLDEKWEELLGKTNYFVCTLDELDSTISKIITSN